MKVFIKHGTPVKEKVLNIYRHLATETFNNDPPSDPNAAYANFGTLRKVLYKVVESLKQAGSEHQLEFDNLLLISHYFAIRSAMQSIGGLETHIAKVSPRLLIFITLTQRDFIINLSSRGTESGYD